MRPVADGFRQAGQQVSGLQQGLGPLVARDLMGLDGATAEQIAKSTQALTSAPPYYLPTLVDQFGKMATYVDTTADEFLRMKVQSIITLASLLVSIAVDLAIAIFFPQVGPAEMAANFAIVRFILSTLIGRLLTHLIMTAVMSVAIQEALDVVGQLVVNAELHQDWNWAETAQMAEVGALGGAMGLMLMPLDRVLGDFVGHALVTGTDAVLGKLGMELGDLGKGMVEGLGEFAVGAVVGGVHNAGHETLFNAMQGNGWSWGTFSGGAAQGVSGVIGRGLAAGFKLATMTATLPAEQLLARGLGDITPAILNDIATAGPGHAGRGRGAAGGGAAEGRGHPARPRDRLFGRAADRVRAHCRSAIRAPPVCQANDGCHPDDRLRRTAPGRASGPWDRHRPARADSRAAGRSAGGARVDRAPRHSAVGAAGSRAAAGG